MPRYRVAARAVMVAVSLVAPAAAQARYSQIKDAELIDRATIIALGTIQKVDDHSFDFRLDKILARKTEGLSVVNGQVLTVRCEYSGCAGWAPNGVGQRSILFVGWGLSQDGPAWGVMGGGDEGELPIDEVLSAIEQRRPPPSALISIDRPADVATSATFPCVSIERSRGLFEFSIFWPDAKLGYRGFTFGRPRRADARACVRAGGMVHISAPPGRYRITVTSFPLAGSGRHARGDRVTLPVDVIDGEHLALRLETAKARADGPSSKQRWFLAPADAAPRAPAR